MPGHASTVKDNGGHARQPDVLRDVGLLARLYGSPLTHRLLPTPTALWLAASAGAKLRERRNPGELANAERFMGELLRDTPRAGEAAALAPRWLAEKSRNQELLWRPWLLPKSSVEGVEHWHAAHEGGRGCVVVFGHVGPTWSVAPVLWHGGLTVHIVIGPHYWFLDPGLKGLEFRYRRRTLGEDTIGPDRLISSEGPPERLKELVESGESVLLAWDAPGRAQTPFLGRTIPVGGAAPRLAFATRTKVLPAIPERRGSRIVVRLHPPLDSTDYEDARSLRAAIARFFEPIVVARPEEVELAWNPSPLVVEGSDWAEVYAESVGGAS